MQETTSIGSVLKQAREERGLSLQDVHDATKITAQNLAALEEDHFEAFPNKVYARAFLRDYSNFLGLDSPTLVTRYETEWGQPRDVEQPRPAPSSRKGFRLAYALVTLLVLGAIGTGSYFWWVNYEKGARRSRVVRVDRTRHDKHESVLPPTPVVEQDKPVPNFEVKPSAGKPVAPPEPVVPAEPGKFVLEVTALRDVWVRVWADGQSVANKLIKAGTTEPYEAKKTLRIRSGMAGAVQLKVNGKPEPSLGSLKVVGDRTIQNPAPPTARSTPAATPPAAEPKPGNGALRP